MNSAFLTLCLVCTQTDRGGSVHKGHPAINSLFFLPKWPLEPLTGGGGEGFCDIQSTCHLCISPKRPRGPIGVGWGVRDIPKPQIGCPPITARCSDHKWTSHKEDDDSQISGLASRPWWRVQLKNQNTMLNSKGGLQGKKSSSFVEISFVHKKRS